MARKLSRRALVQTGMVTPWFVMTAGAARTQPAPSISLPIRWPGQTPGDGFFLRHGYACENTWYNPGWWHTGEDWYALADAETGGAEVVAVAAGMIVFADSDYPGRVVIVQHAADLFSMYGHLEYALDVEAGQTVAAGDRLGVVLHRTDGRAPSHLHFEMRRFLFATEVNGDAPRYEVGCGFQCAPGPGYWPIDAPEHPSRIGWLNPTHQLARMMTERGLANDLAVVNSGSGAETAEIRTAPSLTSGDRSGILTLTPGKVYPLLEIAAGDPASTGTSAEAYALWYRIRIDDGRDGWAQAAVASNHDTGSDGRPSSVRFRLLPKV